MNTEVGAISMVDHIKLQTDSGMSVLKYCETNELKEHTFRYWKTRQNKKKTSGNFKLVEKTESIVNHNPIMKLVFPNQIELLIYSELSPEYVRQLM